MPSSSIDRHSFDHEGGEPTPYLRLPPPPTEHNNVNNQFNRFQAHIQWCLCCSNLRAAKVLAILFAVLTLAFILGNILSSTIVASLPFESSLPQWLRLFIFWLPSALCAVFTAFLLAGTFLISLLILTIIPGIISTVMCIATSVDNEDGDKKVLLPLKATTLSPADAAAAQFDRDNYGLPVEERKRAFGILAETVTTSKPTYYQAQNDSGATDLVIFIVGTLILVLATSLIQLWCILIVDGAWRELRRQMLEAHTQQAIYFYNNHNMARVVSSDDAEDAVAVHQYTNDTRRHEEQHRYAPHV